MRGSPNPFPRLRIETSPSVYESQSHSNGNSLPKPTRGTMIALLNQQLADAIDLGLQAKQAHWNVKGPHFIGLHELFDKVTEELEEFTDDIAERAIELVRQEMSPQIPAGLPPALLE